jgi:hypothetical protein
MRPTPSLTPYLGVLRAPGSWHATTNVTSKYTVVGAGAGAGAGAGTDMDTGTGTSTSTRAAERERCQTSVSTTYLTDGEALALMRAIKAGTPRTKTSQLEHLVPVLDVCESVEKKAPLFGKAMPAAVAAAAVAVLRRLQFSRGRSRPLPWAKRHLMEIPDEEDEEDKDKDKDVLQADAAFAPTLRSVFRKEPGVWAFPDDAVPVFGLSPREAALLCGTQLLSFPSHVAGILHGCHDDHTCLVQLCPSLETLAPWDLAALETALAVGDPTGPGVMTSDEVEARVRGVHWQFLRLDPNRLWPAATPGLDSLEVATLATAFEEFNQGLKPCIVRSLFPCQEFLFTLTTLGAKNEWELATLLLGMATIFLQRSAM